MKPPLSDIKSRRQFQKILAQTRDELRARAAAEPVHPLWNGLLAQIQAMEEWTRGGRVPTKEERDKIVVGTIAMRELEPTDDIPLYDLCQRLHELQYYFRQHL